MQVQSSPFARAKQPIRFGGAGGTSAGKLGGLVGGVDATFRNIGSSRGREMIVEDLMGFGFLRTGMDLMRGYFYGNGTLNIPAAGERLFRESSSIFTDNVLSGIAAWALGKQFDKNGKSFSNGFTDFPTLELFQKAIEDGDENEIPFLKRLSQWILENKASNGSKLTTEELKQTADNLEQILQKQVWEPQELTKEHRMKQATKIAKKLGRDSFDIQLIDHGKGQAIFKLDNLLDDIRIFKDHMGKRMATEGKKSRPWATIAKESIQNTLKAKNYKLLCIGLGMATTFAVPFVNVGLTKMIYGLDYYPGEIGLRKPNQQRESANQTKSFFEKHFPYVMDSLHKGNWLPLLLTAVPLPFAMGFFNTATMRFVNPLKKNVLRNMFDFCKDAPFTAQQQMASMFALLITSRLLCARSDNEFRERMVDSFLGWGLWILGTPAIKKAVAAYLDNSKKGTMLQKVLPDGSTALRTRSEIDKLLIKSGAKAVSSDTLMATRKAHILLGAGSTVMSMILLGIVEPWIGIHWTKYNEERKAKATGVIQTAGIQPALLPASKPQPFKGNNIGFYGGFYGQPPTTAPGFGFAYTPQNPYSAPFGQWPPRIPQQIQTPQPQAWVRQSQ